MNNFLNEQKLTIKGQELQNQDLKQKLKHMNMVIKLMKNTITEE